MSEEATDDIPVYFGPLALLPLRVQKSRYIKIAMIFENRIHHVILTDRAVMQVFREQLNDVIAEIDADELVPEPGEHKH